MKNFAQLSLLSTMALFLRSTINRRVIVCVASVALISGCSEFSRPTQQEMAYHTENVIGTGTKAPIAARVFMAPDATLSALPTVTVILKSRNEDLDAVACSAFKKIKTLPSVLSTSQLMPNIILWRWPLLKPVTNENDCSEMVKNYNYDSAEEWLNDIAASESSENKSSLSGSGPYLVEQIPDKNGIHYVIIDLEKSKGTDANFDNVTNKLIAMIEAQSDIVNGKTASQPSAAKNTWTSKIEDIWNGFVKYFCGGANSNVGKLVLAALNFVPNASEAVTVINTIDKAVCPNGGSDTDCTKNNSGQTTGNS